MPDFLTLLHLVCIGVGAVVLPIKLRHLVIAPSPDLVAFCAYVALSLVSYVVLLPPVYAAIGDATGVASAAGAFSAICVLGLIAAQQALLMYWQFSPAVARVRVRRRLAFFGVMVLLYVVAFLAWLPHEQFLGEFYVRYSKDHPLAAPYLVVYIVGCVIGQASVVRHCLRHARSAHRRAIRIGMLVTGAGAAMILVYCAVRVGDLVAGLVGADLTPLEPGAVFFGDIGSAVALLGWIVPNVVDVGRSSSRRSVLRRDYLRLQPLHEVMYRAAPELVLAPPEARWRGRLRRRDLEFWLHRRVIEIEDVWHSRRDLDDGDATTGRSIATDGTDRATSRAELSKVMELLSTTVPRPRDPEPDRDPDVERLCVVSDELVRWRRSHRTTPVGTERPPARS